MISESMKELFLEYFEESLNAEQREVLEQEFSDNPQLSADYQSFVRTLKLSQSLSKEQYRAPEGFYNEVMEAIKPQRSTEELMKRLDIENETKKSVPGMILSAVSGLLPYATLASLVVILCISSVTFLGQQSSEVFETVGSHLGSDVGLVGLYDNNQRHKSLLAREVLESDYQGQASTEEYQRIYENSFLDVKGNPLSTFSIDVDTASYANTRRFLNQGMRPPKDAVRIEELINYFDYDYPAPEESGEPFSVTTELAESPWSEENSLLLHIGLQGREVARNELPASSLVFLIDVSGSMSDRNKLPLLKNSLLTLVDQLSAKDRVSIVVYAGAAGVVLEPTYGDNRREIASALRRLKAGGSTAGAQGIELAYRLAEDSFIEGGNNRVILATDGDFNVGISSTSELIRLIEDKREKRIFLTVPGFGTGNYKDHRMEQMANKGNGNYYYIDSEKEAEKVFVQDLRGTLFTIAKDVKIQIEFNPAHVQSYRLVGYENRLLKKEDFNNDKIDAGEIGAGHTVTAIYEIVPKGSSYRGGSVDPLRYQSNDRKPEQPVESRDRYGDELATIKLRYKEPEGNVSRLMQEAISSQSGSFEASSQAFRFSTAVAAFGMMLRDSEYKGTTSYQMIEEIAERSIGQDPFGFRREFLELVSKAESLR